jgi:hypothetical protein
MSAFEYTCLQCGKPGMKTHEGWPDFCSQECSDAFISGAPPTPNPVSTSLAQKGEEEREAFEKAVCEEWGLPHEDIAGAVIFARDENGDYKGRDLNWGWQIWQAARSTPDHRDERIRELEAEIERERKEFRIERLRAMAAAEHDYGRHERADNLAKRADRLCDELAALSNSLPTEEHT